MTTEEQVILQAKLMSPAMAPEEAALLEAACKTATTWLAFQLRPGFKPEDIGAEFIIAAAFIAMAAMSQLEEGKTPEQFTAGDLTVRRGSANAAAECLRMQAKMAIAPYVTGGLTFLGV